MRKILILSLLLTIVLSFSSCSMEKRLYRKGWYIEHSQTSIPFENNLVQPKEIHKIFPPKQITAIPKTIFDTTVIFRKRKQANNNNQTVNRTGGNNHPMTYQQAKEKLTEKGAKPDKEANTLYLLSIASIPLFLFTGLGFILALVVLLLSNSAKQKIIAKGGNGETENLAIVDAAKRIAWSVVIAEIILTVFAVLLILLLFGML